MEWETEQYFKEGDKVHYKRPNGKIENGIVKSISPNGAFVVYHCAGEWEKYREYTAALTSFDDLTKGWVEEIPIID